MKNNALTIVVGVSGLVLSALGVGYGLGQRKKLADISDRLDRSIDDLSKDIKIDIQDEVIETAVANAAERESRKAVQKAISDIIASISTSMRNQVTTEISRQKENIKDDVTVEIKRQVARLSIEDLKDSVVEQAKKEASDKLQSSMDDILENFNNNLSQVGKIYQSIAQSFPNGGQIKLS